MKRKMAETVFVVMLKHKVLDEKKSFMHWENEKEGNN